MFRNASILFINYSTNTIVAREMQFMGQQRWNYRTLTVRELTRSANIKLNARLLLSRHCGKLSFRASDIAPSPDILGEAIGRSYYAWRLCWIRGNVRRYLVAINYFAGPSPSPVEPLSSVFRVEAIDERVRAKPHDGFRSMLVRTKRQTKLHVAISAPRSPVPAAAHW
jgi:hypothetical protein